MLIIDLVATITASGFRFEQASARRRVFVCLILYKIYLSIYTEEGEMYIL